MGRDISILKKALIGVNILFFFAGIVLIVIGFSVLLTAQDCLIATLSGFETIIFAIIGWYIANKEKTVGLKRYAIVLWISLSIHLLGSTYVFFWNVDLQKIDEGLRIIVNEYYSDYEYEKVMDKLQTTFKCCGVDGPADYMMIPLSCPKADSNLDVPGCFGTVKKYLEKNNIILISVFLIFGILKIAGAVLAWLLRKSLLKQSNTNSCVEHEA